MKTAEQSALEIYQALGCVTGSSLQFIIAKVKESNLVAMKEGMKRAATMVFPFDAERSSEDDAPWLAERKRILSAAEQLTEKDVK